VNLLSVGGSLLKYGGSIVKYAADCICCAPAAGGCCPGTQIKDCTPIRFADKFGVFPYLNGNGETHCLPSEWNPVIFTEEECEECMCKQHSDWVYVDCECEDGLLNCPDCPEDYLPYGVVIKSDCSGLNNESPCYGPGPHDAGKKRCIRKTSAQASVPCCEVSDSPPTDCFGNVANQGNVFDMTGECGEFYPSGCDEVNCGYSEFP